MIAVTEFISIILAAALVNNLLLIEFLGVSTALHASKAMKQAIEIALFTVLLLISSCICNLLIFHYLLDRFALQYLQLISFVSVNAIFALLLAQQLAKYFPLSIGRHKLLIFVIGANSAVIGLSIQLSENNLSLLDNMIYTVGSAIGFALILINLAAIRLRLDQSNIPRVFKGAAITLISCGLFTLSLLGFAGLV